MCGIFGFVKGSPATAGYREFMYNSLIVGQLRGMDGAGLAVIDKDFVPASLAKATLGMNLAHSKAGQELLNKVVGSRAAFGHHRFKTHGEDKDEHCHPFVFNHITGVHNGTVPAHTLRNIDIADSHEVDSGRIYAALSKTKDPLDVLKKIDMGAYALVWFDEETNTVHMARNTERPLHVIEGPTGVLFASEAGMLEWLSGRALLHMEGTSMSLLDPLTLYSFPLEDVSKVTATKYEVTREYHQYAPYAGYNLDSNYWQKPLLASDESDLWKNGCELFWTMEKLVDTHPADSATITSIMDAMYLTPMSTTASADMVLFARAKEESIRGQHVMYGILMKPNTLIPMYYAPVIVRAYMDTLSKTLPERHHKNTQYPVVSAVFDKAVLTIEGDVVPIFRMPELRAKDSKMVGFEPLEFAKAENICSVIDVGAIVVNRRYGGGYN